MRRLAALGALLWLVGCGVPTAPDVAALGAKAKAGDRKATRTLVKLLGSDRPAELRLAAYQELLSAGQPAAAEILAACADADATRREQALALVGNLKLAGGYEEAMRALADASFRRRYVAAWALGELGDARAAETLVSALGSAQGETAREAARSLVKLGPPGAAAVLAALPRLGGEARGYALRILGEIRDPAGIRPLVAALSDPTTRADAAWALGTLGAPEAAGPLLGLLADPEWRVRLEAVRALGLLEAAEADAPLETLRRVDPVASVREWAARSLSLLRGRPETYPNAKGEWVEPENLYR